MSLVLVYFAAWYAVNVVYNDTNKSVLKVLHLPYTVAALQLGCGVLYLAPLWLAQWKHMPKVDRRSWRQLLPVSGVHALGQCVTVASLGAGSIAFVNVVKSLEPLFNVLFGAVLVGDNLPWQVNLCLLPVVGGVALASAGEVDFTWECFLYAMGSNVAFSLRGVLSKANMGHTLGQHMDAGNTFAVLTIVAFLLTLPWALYLEGPRLGAEWRLALEQGPYSPASLTARLLASGLSFYLYNEISFYTLAKVHPITHAVGNTVKRVILILFSVLRFGTTMTKQSVAGSSIAIAGVLAYSMAKQHYARSKERKAA